MTRYRLAIFLSTVLCTCTSYAAENVGTSSNPGLTDPIPVSIEQEEARERELTSEEDPLGKRQTEKVDMPEKLEDEPDGIKIYGSARIRYRFTDFSDFAASGNSRIGVNGQWQYQPRKRIIGRVEAGINVQQALGEPFFKRLMYIGVETPKHITTFGKNWSTYYQVSGFTDLFDSTGASASGTYNAGTDGGPTGTGRADYVLQSRLLVDWLPASTRIKPFDLNVQAQNGREIPEIAGENYGLAFGLSGIVKTQHDTEIGLALNYAEIPNKGSPTLTAAGIDGDAVSVIAGYKHFRKNWFLATTIARLHNQETTDQGDYFNGWGWEVYGRYRLKNKLWAVGGWNWLQPDKGQSQATNYVVKYGVVGLRYAFEEFRRLIYIEARLDDSLLENATAIGNSYAVGFRWDLP
jgi:predicted porin